MKLLQATVSNEPDIPSVNLREGTRRALISTPPVVTGASAYSRMTCVPNSETRVRYPRHIPVPIFDRARYTRLNSFSSMPTIPINIDSD
ncbi:MAG: hypothetical protein N3E45_13030 [Oscillatoriaceae bacterium SKW80]|nr:hypothetical protein [Oscillatoriaceae bacterium SKYG93]MCX8121724.1 hypothetical protein [Oscillatoriaceae bacterium SKW80]MDW8453660.1 hypothetical protein [Oscillatoriaceae cyanobacterium SKYGB_i_bin93]HIK28725.1 hypothetical protein [Oscillatoriaceae cyanobacterium M7585_C2015_266]